MPVLSGLVVGADGNPVSRAKVYFVSAPVSVPDIAALTNEDGQFQLTAPVPGVYTLGATGDSGGSGKVTVETGPEGVAGLSIRLNK